MMVHSSQDDPAAAEVVNVLTLTSNAGAFLRTTNVGKLESVSDNGSISEA